MNPSTNQSCGPKSKTKSRLPSYRLERKPSEPAHKIQAVEGESVASRHNIGTASIDSDFYKIEYGQSRERPASLIIVDVRLVYPPDNTIDRAKLEFQCATDSAHNICSVDHGSAANTKAPISKVFAPELIEGQPTCSKKKNDPSRHQAEDRRPELQNRSWWRRRRNHCLQRASVARPGQEGRTPWHLRYLWLEHFPE